MRRIAYNLSGHHGRTMVNPCEIGWFPSRLGAQLGLPRARARGQGPAERAFRGSRGGAHLGRSQKQRS